MVASSVRRGEPPPVLTLIMEINGSVHYVLKSITEDTLLL